MIHKTEASAREVAAALNRRPGHMPAHAVPCIGGWTVIVAASRNVALRHAQVADAAERTFRRRLSALDKV